LLTLNAGETDIGSLLSNNIVLSIPYFQRAYKWDASKTKQLCNDLLTLVDEDETAHFLGAIIVHPRPTNPSDPKIFEVIDGQQRLTTLVILLAAIAKVYCSMNEHEDAARLFENYLVVTKKTSLASNAKLHSSRDDRCGMNALLGDLLADEKFSEHLSGFQFKKLAATPGAEGRVLKNYKIAIRFFKDQLEDGGRERVDALYGALVQAVTVVQIVVKDPTDGPRIYDSLNSMQEPMTTGDLVKNEIFRKVANEHPDNIETIDNSHWQPFFRRFADAGKNRFDEYFFPFGLILNPNLRKSEVYSFLRDRWKAINEPSKIIQELATYQDSFLDICMGSNCQGHSTSLALRLKTLTESKSPASIFPFLMRLSNAVKHKEITDVVAAGTLLLLESFLVRRAICGHEPTGLHAVFKRLWNDCDGDLSTGRVAAEIKKHKTVAWPTDEDVTKAVKSRPLYRTAIASFLISEWNSSLGGDAPNIEPEIEHVLPQTITPYWNGIFSTDQHALQKDLLANLLPISEKMNPSLSNGPYTLKREAFRKDSCFKATRAFADAYDHWTPETIEERGEQLSVWILARWKGI
jgi:uncharacterized protein with ParB-like and HNH nuclease domain